jgi:hypothetical protein
MTFLKILQVDTFSARNKEFFSGSEFFVRFKTLTLNDILSPPFVRKEATGVKMIIAKSLTTSPPSGQVTGTLYRVFTQHINHCHVGFILRFDLEKKPLIFS